MRSLIYSASDRAVRDVYVDGRQVVRNGEPLLIDLEPALATLGRAQASAVASTADRDWAGREADELSPMVYRTYDPTGRVE